MHILFDQGTPVPLRLYLRGHIVSIAADDACRLLPVRVAAEKALPFEPLNSNADTVAAMKAARRGDLIKASKPDQLLRSLNAGDSVHQRLSVRLQARKIREAW